MTADIESKVAELNAQELILLRALQEIKRKRLDLDQQEARYDGQLKEVQCLLAGIGLGKQGSSAVSDVDSKSQSVDKRPKGSA